VFLLTLRLEISKNKGDRSDFLFEFERKLENLWESIKNLGHFSYFWRYGGPS
jgi:hypothetical protein